MKKKKVLATYASTCWTKYDIKTLRPRWTLKRCEEWLIDNEKYLQEALISHGWEVIMGLLPKKFDNG